ncbi:hypothetical protein EG338_12385 [Kaistella haifensis]|nr:hypothetical protein EG338_12385 [Kaistella haifensis]
MRRNCNNIGNQHQTAKKYFHLLNSIKYNDVFLNEMLLLSCFLLVVDFYNEFFCVLYHVEFFIFHLNFNKKNGNPVS